MNAEFNWWLLIVGLVIGAGLVWLVLADGSRRDVDVTTRERAGEARWIAEELRRAGRSVGDHDVEDVLDLHAAYLAGPPPDEPVEEATAMPVNPAADPDSTSLDPADSWPGQPPTGEGSLPMRTPMVQPAGQTQRDGDGLPV